MNELANRIKLTTGDITRLKLDAIVTAANSALRGGGGVDGAVHAAAGPELVAASLALAPCPPGEARITSGFRLPAKWVIHAVGPIYRGGSEREAETLASAYACSLALARENALRSIAFPCISTGVYGYPKAEAADVAISTVVESLRREDMPISVTFCCYDPADAALYRERFRDLGIEPSPL